MKKQVLLCAVLVGIVTGYCDLRAQTTEREAEAMLRGYEYTGYQHCQANFGLGMQGAKCELYLARREATFYIAFRDNTDQRLHIVLRLVVFNGQWVVVYRRPTEGQWSADTLDFVEQTPLPEVAGGEEILEFRPTPEMVALWHEVEECVGNERNLDEIRFYVQVADERNTIPCDGGQCFGRYEPEEKAFYFADTLVRSIILLKHEFIHPLIVETGHPAYIFWKCARWTPHSTPFDGEWL